MTREQIEHIKRAASAAQAMKIDPACPDQFKFRAHALFAQIVTPEAVVALCDEALRRQYFNVDTDKNA
ncbi:hypothetical protein AWB77_04818 [Caballeronia fortuita]|uniref:Uncharacterized protein n=1 Tax=Caballeronia fortuita TaxID=1777138 RepID=A0A158D2P9_9BURK|nr:hypothetical protein [Caballeronia fortuita]SAK88761.1 hypothetical protein AWB77_04818 [Caballeronia fortuita]